MYDGPFLVMAPPAPDYGTWRLKTPSFTNFHFMYVWKKLVKSCRHHRDILDPRLLISEEVVPKMIAMYNTMYSVMKPTYVPNYASYIEEVTQYYDASNDMVIDIVREYCRPKSRHEFVDAFLDFCHVALPKNVDFDYMSFHKDLYPSVVAYMDRTQGDVLYHEWHPL